MRKIYGALSQILGDILGLSPDTVAPDASLAALSYQERASAAIGCEKTFHVALQDERVAELATVAQWHDYLLELMRDDARPFVPPTDAQREQWAYESASRGRRTRP